MKNQLFSLSKIFTERLLRIPDYQRGYAWTERQLKDFWSDLIQMGDDKNHYTGVLTLEDVPENTVSNWSEDYWIVKSKGYTPFYVVDGQQRLTTSIIMIQAITEYIPENKKLNYNTVDDIRKKFIYDSKDDGISRSYIFGYEKDNPSYEFLKTKVFLEKSENSFPIQETIYTHNLEIAKNFFLNKLKSMSFEYIEEIYRKLTQNLLFNIYSISEEIDVFVAFETMNNRGKPLSHLELLKNRLIYLSTKYNDQDFEKNRLRNQINEAWKSIYHYLGKNKLNPLDDDVFLYNHFKLYFGDDVQREDLDLVDFERLGFMGVKGYKDYLLEEKFTTKNIINHNGAGQPKITIKDIYLYVQSLKESVEIWYHILNPKDCPYSSEEKLWLEKLNRLNIKPIAPLIMVFYQKEETPKLRVRLLKSLERHLFISILIGHYVHSLGIERIEFYNLANQLFKGEISSEKIIRDIEQYIDIISTPEMINYLAFQFKDSGYYNWRGIRYFLYEYDLDLKDKSRSYRDKIDSVWFF